MRCVRGTGNVLLLACLLFLSAQCSPRLKTVDPSSVGPPLRFVQDGVATREQIRKSLGPPSATFETGRVEIWNLDEEQRPFTGNDGGKAPRMPQAVKYNLVVVFDDQGFVERHALLRIR